jgi:hypothetical protein
LAQPGTDRGQKALGQEEDKAAYGLWGIDAGKARYQAFFGFF